MVPQTVDDVVAALARHGYVADRGLAVTILLALELGRPLFLEGEAGVGKTEVAKVLAAILDTDLIRLQCYEGLDVNHALYEWDYARQMLAIRLIEARGEGGEAGLTDIMSREYLRPRPLLQAIEAAALGRRPVLLIDELDRADEEFEAYLLELLSDFQVTLPEIGTIRAEQPPVVVVTSNRTREIHDALKRRCLYHWLDYPSVERELEILRVRQPEVDEALGRQLAMAMADLRALDLFKPPGVAETLDWAAALRVLGAKRLTPSVFDESLGVVLKYREDLERVREVGLETLVHE
ncbi:MAG TPA: MoxR family ATPase [Acidimicrobiia bacterium]|nr:MoxR family ATPase [Acidimicrobiia bacterium]